MRVPPAFRSLLRIGIAMWLAALVLHGYPYMHRYIANWNCCSTINECDNQLRGHIKVLCSRKPLLNPNARLPSVCANESCRADYVRRLHTTDEYPIPAIRHILWRNESVSAYFAEQLRTWHRIHPDWTYVLWRDQDLEPFVAAHFPGLLAKFKSLPRHIMRVDMIRYMLLFKYGGIYADLDYRLVQTLDDFRRFHAVVTREADLHSLLAYGMTWPVTPMANPAFMMAAPGHVFFHYAMQQLLERDIALHVTTFAGPNGLTDIMKKYQSLFPLANSPMETVYVPPSNSFYPYPENRLNTSTSEFVGSRIGQARQLCKSLMSSTGRDMQQLRESPNFTQYCRDVNILDSITDKSQTVFAIHDLMKPSGIWFGSEGRGLYTRDLIDLRAVLANFTLGIDFVPTAGP